jgi:hypothetical protein
MSRPPKGSLFRKGQPAMPSLSPSTILIALRSICTLARLSKTAAPAVFATAASWLYSTRLFLDPTATPSIRSRCSTSTRGPVIITLPDAGKRFMSMQVIDEDQYTYAVYYGAGPYTVTREEIGTRYGLLGIRILVNPQNLQDMKQVHALQVAIRVEHKSSGNFEVQNFDPISQKKGPRRSPCVGQAHP